MKISANTAFNFISTFQMSFVIIKSLRAGIKKSWIKKKASWALPAKRDCLQIKIFICFSSLKAVNLTFLFKQYLILIHDQLMEAL